MRRSALNLLVLAVVACRAPTTPLPSGAERFSPPPVYAEWWGLTEACSGLTGDFSGVTWYRIPNSQTVPFGEGELVNGLWEGDGNRIILGGDDLEDGDLVRHEMLHALLQRGGHPRSMFIGRCRSTVVCTGPCITDGGPAPPPDPSAIAVRPAYLGVSVEIVPTAPGGDVNGGYFMMIVSARNPSRLPVIAQLPPSGDAGPSGSFGYWIWSGSNTYWYGLRAEVPEDSEFAAFETKRMIFDFHVGTGGTRYDLPPGVFYFGGSYGSVGAANLPLVTVSP
ncbi:MAG TPA: hypothetical protein VK733_10865 [Gemmatimonadaceae bacterium]|jgi:hypothetical protein|nr:hypothetical protein [Gemmatimonadaceae bacterium]